MENTIILSDVIDGLKSIEDESIHLIITSPPYNLFIQYDGYDDNLSSEDYAEWMKKIWLECKRVMVKGGRICINMGEDKKKEYPIPTFSMFIQQCIDIGLLYRSVIIWNKNTSSNHTAWGSWNSCSNPHIIPGHEYIIVFSKDSFKLECVDGKSDMSKDGKEFISYTTRGIWNIPPESKQRIGHPAPFPIEIPYRLIKLYSYVGNVVLDPFAGSGTTGVACIQTNRRFILIDHSKQYVELMQKRIEDILYGNLLYKYGNINIKEILNETVSKY